MSAVIAHSLQIGVGSNPERNWHLSHDRDAGGISLFQGNRSAPIKRMMTFDQNGVRLPNPTPPTAHDTEVVTASWAQGQVQGYIFETGFWMGARTALPSGHVAMDGQQISDLTVPGLRDRLASSGIQVVSESEWQADPLKRGMWSSGGEGWLRVPDWNGVQPGSIGGLYTSGDLGGSRRGNVVSDAIRNITGSMTTNHSLALYGGGSASGAFRLAGQLGGSVAGNSGTTWDKGFIFDASMVVPTADENRPKTVYGTWIIRIHNVVDNPLGISVSQLRADVDLLLADRNTSWVVKTSERLYGVTYTNGQQIKSVMVVAHCNSAITDTIGFSFVVDGVTVQASSARGSGAGGNTIYVTFDVPPFSTYSVTRSVVGGVYAENWWETE